MTMRNDCSEIVSENEGDSGSEGEGPTNGKRIKMSEGERLIRW